MPNRRTHLTRLGALALASAATLGAAGVAGATTPGSSGTTGSSGSNDVPSTLAGIKAKANTDITDRVNSLNSAIEKVKAAKGLGSGQGTLEAYLGTDITPLQQLDATIQGETSAQQAAADFRTIFTNFRVYRLVLPATHIAGDAFRVTTTAVPNLQAASTKAQQYVNPGNQGVLEPLIDDLNGQIERGEQRHQWPGRHRARLHAPAVERQQQPPGAFESVRCPGRRGRLQGPPGREADPRHREEPRAGLAQLPERRREHADHHLIPHRSHRLPEARSPPGTGNPSPVPGG